MNPKGRFLFLQVATSFLGSVLFPVGFFQRLKFFAEKSLVDKIVMLWYVTLRYQT